MVILGTVQLNVRAYHRLSSQFAPVPPQASNDWLEVVVEFIIDFIHIDVMLGHDSSHSWLYLREAKVDHD